MIEIKGLSRHFGSIKAVDKISFEIAPGEIVGFLGPNGAGKTTTMRMMVGYLQPTEGEILIDGESIFFDPIKTSHNIGYLPENNPLYNDLSVYEFLKFVSALRGMTEETFAQRLEFVGQNCGLKAVMHQKIGTLSKGYRQRTGLAQAILHDPKILILDEPTSGLDPNQIIEIRDLIRELGREKTLILSSHIMQEVQALCDRIIIISNGIIVANAAQDELVRQLDKDQEIRLVFEAESPLEEDLLAAVPDLKLIMREDNGNQHCWICAAPGERDVHRELAQYAQKNSWLILEMSSQKKSLEDVFVNLTKVEPDGPAMEVSEEEGGDQ